jgi:hypothetical protein
MNHRGSRLFGCALALALGAAQVRAAPPPTEYQVKAAYLFNFGQFVAWPPGSFESARAPFVIGVVGDDPFGSVLDELVRGENIDGHPLEVRRFRHASDVASCNILFIARSEVPHFEQIMDAIRGHSVLTVTDAADSRDATIVLLNDHQRIRMRINLAAAHASNLVISSKLLRPAEVVNDAGDKP